MSNFKGFNTIGQHKKFTLTDTDLIKRDLNNSFAIRTGEMPGKPLVGTAIWDYIYDPADSYTAQKIETEITRVVSMDTRIELHEVRAEINENTINAYLSVTLHPSADVAEFYIIFNKESQAVSIY
jgi:phage baseplate assembly protein W